MTRKHAYVQMLRGEESSALCDAVAEVSDEAAAHLLAARSMSREVPAEARAVLLPATVADQCVRVRGEG